MALIQLQNISIAFGGPLLLEDLTLEIQKGQRICIVGRNGAGKSTLLKIIANEISADAGTRVTETSVKVAYLQQDMPEGLTGSVFKVVTAGAGDVGEKLATYHDLALAGSHTDEFYALQHYLDEHNGWQIETAVKRALSQVDLDGDLDVATLSGGMLRRVMLARALVHAPEVLLLDEPTNHLDIKAIAWLESFILGSRLTVVFVTHDRKLLRRLATRIVELDRGKLHDWSCDYDTFIERKNAVLESEEREWAKFDKKLGQEEIWIRRGVKARRTRNEGRVRALIRMREERRQRREKSGNVSMVISLGQRSGERVLDAEHVEFSYENKPVIRDLSIAIGRGDKIGILGPNGCGKTTLLKILLGQLTPHEGTLTFGSNLLPVYFDQLRDVLSPEKTVWENVAPNGNDTVFVNGQSKHVISYLQDFLFTPDRAKSPVKQLSGGERNRLMLARLFTRESNVLVLDEPTNDLDTETLELLEELLGNYAGTVLLVSHDREFLNNVVTSTLVFEGNGFIKEYVGGYDDWEQRQKKESLVATIVESTKTASPATGESKTALPFKKLSYKETRLLAELPLKIEQLEKEQTDLHAQMSDPTFFKQADNISQATARLAEIEKILEKSYALWDDLESRTPS
jgi:ATP-binding cassette subfamily F protein uup